MEGHARNKRPGATSAKKQGIEVPVEHDHERQRAAGEPELSPQ